MTACASQCSAMLDCSAFLLQVELTGGAVCQLGSKHLATVVAPGSNNSVQLYMQTPLPGLVNEH